MADPPLQIGRIALKGGLLTGGAQIVKVGVSTLSVVVLARLLAPDDFGLAASIAPVIAFVGLFQNLGLQQAIVQRPEIEDRHLNQTFWISALVGILAAVIIVAAAPLVASFYGDERIRGLMILAALPVILGSLASVPLSLLNRNLRYGPLAVYEIVLSVAGFTAAVIAALSGLGYWSLLIAPVAAGVCGTAMAWTAAPWRPKRPTLRADADLLSFGVNLTGFNLVNFFARNGDNVLIGRFAGMSALGYYDRAYKLLLFPIQNVTQPLSRLMIPLLSRIQEDKARFRDVYMRIAWSLGLVMMPPIAALTMTSEDVVRLLFGERWLGVAPIFAWLGVAGFAQVVTNTNGWIFICQGKTRTLFHLGLYTSVVTVASFAVGLPWGAVGVAAAYSASAFLLRLPVLALVIDRVGPVRGTEFVSVVALFGVAALLAYALLPVAVPTVAGYQSLVTVLVSGLLNYATALILAALYPPSRRVLLGTAGRLKDSVFPKTAPAR
ncbi:lipopolysaccharide biosynthesis protein [Acuticoccus sp. M5D2P5]|uniref:lipopolysaccharide biosynthesis protein n=1 Tax=Acuticoccus kalidii TaxID=2910977 RepID=UPI001F3AEBBC|nr:lipopolysaccharide biosynthesis protein [Acuticoccus kalidii]MCF3936472.1 lipopolysaccharide biosynthesis protein [Acuticoccus kalidii]